MRCAIIMVFLHHPSREHEPCGAHSPNLRGRGRGAGWADSEARIVSPATSAASDSSTADHDCAATSASRSRRDGPGVSRCIAARPVGEGGGPGPLRAADFRTCGERTAAPHRTFLADVDRRGARAGGRRGARAHRACASTARRRICAGQSRCVRARSRGARCGDSPPAPRPSPTIDAAARSPGCHLDGIALVAKPARGGVAGARSRLLVLTGGPGVGRPRCCAPFCASSWPSACGRALRADRPCRQAPHRGHRARVAHHPSAARGQPARRALPPRPAHPLDGDLVVVDESSMVDVPLMPTWCRRCTHSGAAPRRRRRSVAVGRARAGARRRAGVAGVPVARLPRRSRQSAASRIVGPRTRSTPAGSRDHAGGRERRLLPRGRRRRRSRGRPRAWRWFANAFRTASASTRSATSRCCAR